MPLVVQQKALRRLSRLLLFTALLYFTSCTRKAIAPEITLLLKQQEAGQKRLSELEGEISAAKDDPPTASALIEEKELLKSRLIRIQSQLPKTEEAEKAPAKSH